MKTPCPCGTGRPYDACCGPYLAGDRDPATAEALMRSRYTAYTQQRIDYIEATSVEAVRRDFDRRDATGWARSVTFTQLEVLALEAGGPDDATGVVDFAATYLEAGKTRVLHERANFAREKGRWRYVGGTKGESVRREGPKVGRNDPCPCGSGKKFKKCCG